MTTSNSSLVFTACLVAAVAGAPTKAIGAQYHFGIDYGATHTSGHPISAAAAIAFDAAAAQAGQLVKVDFESTPLGPFNVLNPTPILSMRGSFPVAGDDRPFILDAPTGTQSNYSGFNTTAGGTRYNKVYGGWEDFSFSQPVYGFGAFVTGVQNNATYTVTYVDGTSESLSFASLFDIGIFGGSIFVGIVSPDLGITGVRLTIANQLGLPDGVGVDDVRYVGAVPEPGTSALLLTGLAVASVQGRRRRHPARIEKR